MNTVKIYQLNQLSSQQFQRLKAAQMEAAQVWNACMETHKAARLSHEKWPGRNELQKATKGRFALHSQSVQMIVHAFLANVDTTRKLRQTFPQMKVITFCISNEVGTLFIGNPHGIRSRGCGRHHNQRMALWEYGKDIDYLSHKAKQAHILCFTGSERGTSSQCPCCGHKHKPKGRVWCASKVSSFFYVSTPWSIQE